MKWSKKQITKFDLVRMFTACDVMGIEAKHHIWNVAVIKYGANGTSTDK